MSAKDMQAQAEKSSNPNDWVMAGIAWIHEGRASDMYPYCQHMADALRRKQTRLTKRVPGEKPAGASFMSRLLMAFRR